MKMNKYLLQGKLVAKHGSRDELTKIMLQASALMLAKAEGCEMYVVGHSESDVNAVFITEIWATKENHEASLLVDGVRELIGEAMPILAEMPTKGLEVYTV
jgi:quinol monooxygenase YgiN